jgi:predicted amidohydrolase
MATPKTITVAVVQAATESYSLSETLAKLEALTRSAKQEHSAQLVVFPEAFIGGYPKHSTFGVVVGERRDAGRDEYLRYHSSAIDLPSPELRFIEDISKSCDVFLVVGVIERDGGTLYCTAIFVDPLLGLVAKHRKLAPTAMERLIWGQGDGSTLPVHTKSFRSGMDQVVNAKISTTICW